ncbi:MAG: membrane protein insertion efficiency factor YidD [Thermodesulfovibrionia bacterium]|nr:membrane protein insertion efficiency factor YidD [Thermodesulfovibrionia bacterium]
MKALAIFAIESYKKHISPFLPHSCRFYPSCSSYCMEAVTRHGLTKGLWLFTKRIVKCHPFYPGGYDPVKHPDNSL